MKNLFLTFFLYSTQIFAQTTIDSIISIQTEQLKINKIKTFFYFETYCTGGVKLEELGEIDCSVEDSNIYLFWKVNNQCFLKKVSICATDEIKISNHIFDFYMVNLDQMKNENVKFYQTGENSFNTVSHSCFSKFHFYNNEVLIQKIINEYNLTGQHDNLNYEFNNNLRLVILAKLCKKTIQEVDQK